MLFKRELSGRMGGHKKPISRLYFLNFRLNIFKASVVSACDNSKLTSHECISGNNLKQLCICEFFNVFLFTHGSVIVVCAVSKLGS